MERTQLFAWILVLSAILILLFGVEQSQGAPDTDCPNDCNKNGDCTKGKCHCYPGFLHGDDVDDCSEVFLDKYELQWNASRGLCAALFGLSGIVAAVGAFYGVSLRKITSSEQQDTTLTVVNIRRYVLSANTVTCITELLYMAIDPMNIYYYTRGKFHYILSNLLFGSVFCTTLFIYLLILFHWIELYHFSLTSLRTEMMLAKINSQYKAAPVTIESIVSKLVFLQKLKFPCSVLCLSVTIITIVYSIFPSRVLAAAYYSYQVILWLILVLGFLTYGRRLMHLMPPHIGKQVRQWTQRLTLFCVFVVVSIAVLAPVLIIVTGSSNAKTSGAPFRLWINGLLPSYIIFGITVAITSLFTHPNRSWPYLFLSNNRRRESGGSSGGNQSSGNEGGANTITVNSNRNSKEPEEDLENSSNTYNSTSNLCNS